MNECSNNGKTSYVLSTTVVKAFDILEYIAENQPVSPSDITKSLELSRSNVHRILATFVSMGYVSIDDKKYYLSFKLFKLSNSIPFARDLKTIAKPFMIRLMEEVNENVYLNVLSGDMIIAIDMVKSNNHLTLNADKIYTYPLNSCASGKVFLSMLSDDSAFDSIKNLPMTRMTSSTIINRSILLDEIRTVKEKGYATEYQEFSEELNSVAVPVFDYMDQIVATISISGPANRLDSRKINKYLNQLMRTASEVTKQSGN